MSVHFAVQAHRVADGVVAQLAAHSHADVGSLEVAVVFLVEPRETGGPRAYSVISGSRICGLA